MAGVESGTQFEGMRCRRTPSGVHLLATRQECHLDGSKRTLSTSRLCQCLWLFLALACVAPCAVVAQALTGALIGTVRDAQGGVLPGALVGVSSPALVGASTTLTTNEKGQWRFPALPPGLYTLDVEL